jgi:hypothetical protein
MSYAAEKIDFGNLLSYRLGMETYDPDKLGLGPLMTQMSGVTPEDNWTGPLPLQLGRPLEASTAIPLRAPTAMRWSNTPTSMKDWVFFADNATAGATRRIVLYEEDRLTATLTWKGFITVTFPVATNASIVSLCNTYDLHTAGTISASGTAVTGVGTSWQTDRACVGNRIGFGSTDPSEITTWYEISAIGSNTGITLTASAGTIAAGTPYVIEDLRLILGNTNATTTNGGLFVVKGLRVENFLSGGLAIPAATTVDNIRACYWLKSAATITETVNTGIGLQTKTSFQSQMAWFANGTSTCQLFKFNIRAALTLTSGADTTAFQYSTAVSATLTGTVAQTSNAKVVSAGHGPGMGVECLYFITTTRLYRTKALSLIGTGDTTFISAGDMMVEIATGGSATQASSGALSAFDYASSIDKFLITTTTPSGVIWGSFLTEYKTDSSPFDRMVYNTSRLQNGTNASPDAPISIHTSAALQPWVEGGMAYLANNSTTFGWLYGSPIGADWEYAASTGCRIISPRIAVPGVNKFSKAFTASDRIIGAASGSNLGIPPEPYKLYYRTAGIADNSGAWTLVDNDGDLSGVDGSAYIQFMFEFRTMGASAIPARIHSLGVLYDADDSLPPELRWNLSDSNNADGTLGVVQSVVFTTLTSLSITYYRADTNAAVLVQDSNSTANGNWQYHNGTTWVNGLGGNTSGLRRRFIPSAGLPNGVEIYAKVSAT